MFEFSWYFGCQPHPFSPCLPISHFWKDWQKLSQLSLRNFSLLCILAACRLEIGKLPPPSSPRAVRWWGTWTVAVLHGVLGAQTAQWPVPVIWKMFLSAMLLGILHFYFWHSIFSIWNPEHIHHVDGFLLGVLIMIINLLLTGNIFYKVMLSCWSTRHSLAASNPTFPARGKMLVISWSL